MVHPTRSRAQLQTVVSVAALIVAGVGVAASPATAATHVTLFAAPAISGDGSCSGPSNACLVTTAVANAENGDTVLLAAGGYSVNNLTIDTSITLTGTPGSTSPAFAGSNSTVNPIIAVDAPNVTIDDLVLQSSSAAAIESTSTVNGLRLDEVSVSGTEGLVVDGTATIRDTVLTGIAGPAISQYGTGLTTVIDSQLSGNQSGIFVESAPLTVAGTTISGSSIDGIDDHNVAGNPATVTDSTITNNNGVGIASNYVAAISDTITFNSGGGLDSAVAGGVEAGADIVAGNSPDCSEHVGHDDGYNIDNDGSCGLSAASSKSSSSTIAASLTTPASNGGPTQTISLVTHSPAIGLVTGSGHPAAGKAYAICGTADQRGYPRHKAPCDAGAYQTGAPAPAASATVAGSPAKTGTAGHSIALIATLKGNWGPPTGSVAFTADGKALSAACSAAAVKTSKGHTTATCTTAALTFGKHAISARYLGDLDYTQHLPTARAAYTVRYASTSTLTAKKKVKTGTTVSLAVKVAHKQGKPRLTGTVTFTDNGKKLGKVAVTSSGKAVLRHTLKAGKNSIVAAYSGSSTYAPSSSKKVVTAKN